MVPSAPNSTPDPRPTGDLEHLFRQKFAEAEVTPRASLWEQLDHELLVQQNESYRRRLLGYRWAAAASLLLLAGGGTWLSFQPNSPGAVSQPGLATSTPVGRSAVGIYAAPGLASRQEAGSTAASAALPSANTRTSTKATYSASGSDVATAYERRAAGTGQSYYTGQASEGSTGRSLGVNGGQRIRSELGSSLLQDGYRLTAGAGTAPAPAFASAGALASGGADALLARSVSLPTGLNGFGRPAVLPPLPTQTASLLALAQPAETGEEAPAKEPKSAKPRRWRLNAAYAASAFNPNTNFAQEVATSASPHYGNAFAIRTPTDAYEVAAEEYYDKLQAGLGQRVSVTADYALTDRWSVAAGLSLGQQEATSATSWYFLDGKSTAASFYTPAVSVGSGIPPRYDMPLRNVSHRYRTAGLPVSVRYTTNARQGWSIYAKLGAAVNVLLGSRTELEGVPEATRVYALASSDSPYRKVLASLQGSTGVRFQPAAASWSLALGPDLEAGLTTLNANPAQRVLRQARPYAIGMEASVEFGNVKAAPVVRR